jgi:uncharacterized RDD family membrane protein YckC
VIELREEPNPYAPPDPAADVRWQEREGRELQILASRGTRFGAVILDNLLYAGCMVPAGILLAVMIQANPIRALEDMWTFAMPVALGMLAMLGLAIYQWYLIATTGQTLGKKWLGIKIVKMDGGDVDFVSGVVLRSWVIGFIGMVPYIGGCVGLLDALWIFGEEHRCLHDHIAGTKVVLTSMRVVN